MEEDNNNINGNENTSNESTSNEEYKIEVVGGTAQQEKTEGKAEEKGEERAEENTQTAETAEEPSATEEPTSEAPSAPEPPEEEEEEDEEPRRKGNIFDSIGTLFKSLNQLARTLIILAVVALVAWGIFSLQQRAKHKKIVRTITQTVVEVKKIKEFCTANYHEETVVSATRKRFMKSEDLAIIVRGTVRVGFDLSKMSTELTSDTSIVINLPSPIVLDVITNPSDFETFQEDGHWDHKQVTTYKNLARSRILSHAKADGIMEDAEEYAVEKITELFRRIGMKQVTVNVAKPEPTTIDSGAPYTGGLLTVPEEPDPAI